MTEEIHVPLNDIKKLKRSNSRGSNSDIEIANAGEMDTLDFRMQAVDAEDGTKKISLWHDISLVHIDPSTKEDTPFMNFVCEIPKFTRYVPQKLFLFSLFSFPLLG